MSGVAGIPHTPAGVTPPQASVRSVHYGPLGTSGHVITHRPAVSRYGMRIGAAGRLGYASGGARRASGRLSDVGILAIGLVLVAAFRFECLAAGSAIGCHTKSFDEWVLKRGWRDGPC